MRKPYRVILWGPGQVGQACLRGLLSRPEFELVAVLAFSAEKDGMDVGELLNMEPTGLKITTDRDAVIAMEADVVLHTCRTMTLPEDRDPDVIRLLESGKNVISSAAYHYPRATSDEYAVMLEAACQRGGASLHGTGIHPSYADRMITAFSGLMTELDHILIQEFCDGAGCDTPDPLIATGFGQTPEEHEAAAAHTPESLRELFHVYYRSVPMLLANELFGKEMTRFTAETRCVVAEEDIELKALTIKKGTNAALHFTYKAWIGDHHFYTNDEYYYLTPRYCPSDEVSGDYEHAFVLEGKPTSVKARMNYKASQVNDLENLPGDTLIQPQHTTATPMIQAIPIICDAEPGIIDQSRFMPCHYAADFRELAKTAE